MSIDGGPRRGGGRADPLGAPPGGDALPRKTKMVCTIGPTSCTRESLFALADAGMNVARLNMSHGDHASHQAVVDLVKEYNSLGRGCVSREEGLGGRQAVHARARSPASVPPPRSPL